MPLAVRCAGDGIVMSAGGTEARQDSDDDIGRLVQWTLGMPQSSWEVTYFFRHGVEDRVLGLGFGTKDVKKQDVLIMEDRELIVCDVSDGGMNLLGDGHEDTDSHIDLEPPNGLGAAEESIKALYDSAKGVVQFSVTSPRCKGSSVVVLTHESLKDLELYPTAAFASVSSMARLQVHHASAMIPTSRCERLLRMDFASLLKDTDFPSGRVIFLVEGLEVPAERFLLASRSIYFERMLRPGMSEGSSRPVPIPRASRAAFLAVLQFIYSGGRGGEAIFEDADALEVLHLSVEFLLDDLTRLCEWKLMQGLTPERALAVFGNIAAIRSKAPHLVDACMENMRGRVEEACAAPEFPALCRREDVMRELFIAFDQTNAKRRKLSGGSGGGGAPPHTSFTSKLGPTL